MKTILILFAGCALALSYMDELDAEWQNFKEEYQKHYKNKREELLRRHIFEYNKRKIDLHNAGYAAGEESWEIGVNEFTDMLDTEFDQERLGAFNETDDPTELQSSLDNSKKKLR